MNADAELERMKVMVKGGMLKASRCSLATPMSGERLIVTGQRCYGSARFQVGE